MYWSEGGGSRASRWGDVQITGYKVLNIGCWRKTIRNFLHAWQDRWTDIQNWQQTHKLCYPIYWIINRLLYSIVYKNLIFRPPSKNDELAVFRPVGYNFLTLVVISFPKRRTRVRWDEKTRTKGTTICQGGLGWRSRLITGSFIRMFVRVRVGLGGGSITRVKSTPGKTPPAIINPWAWLRTSTHVKLRRRSYWGRRMVRRA